MGILYFSPGLSDVPDSIARWDAARKPFKGKHTAAREDKMATSCEHVVAMREKDKAMMDMF